MHAFIIAELLSQQPFRKSLFEILFFHPFLHRIHKVALHTAEDDYRDEKGEEHHNRAIEQTPPIEGAATKTCVAEGLEQRSERIEHQQKAIPLRCHAEGIYHRSGVHEESNTERDQLGEVAVFCRHGGYDKSPRHGDEGGQQHQQRQEQYGGVDAHRRSHS